MVTLFLIAEGARSRNLRTVLNSCERAKDAKEMRELPKNP